MASTAVTSTTTVPAATSPAGVRRHFWRGHQHGHQ
jgi:hypothetical protein